MVRYKGDYSKESYCKDCDHWTPLPTRIPIDFRVASTNEGNPERYYDIIHDDGNGNALVGSRQREVLILLPVKQLAWNTSDDKGEFIKMIDEIVGIVKCEWCGKKCRGRPVGKADKRNRKDKLRTKQENTITDSIKIEQIEDAIRSLEDKIQSGEDLSLKFNDGVEVRNSFGRTTFEENKKELEDLIRLRNNIEYRNKSLEHVKSRNPKQRIDEWVDIIKNSKDTVWEKTLEDVPPHLRNKVKRRLDKENEGKEDSDIT